MESRWEDITVLQAMEDLETADCGRYLLPSLVERYKRDMIAGDWHETPQGPSYDTSKVLRDGQHRYAALIAAAQETEAAGGARAEDFSLRMWVTRGADPGSFPYLDTGKGRTYGDLLTIRGHANVTNLKAVLRRIATWEAGQPWTRKLTPTNAELDKALIAHPEAQDAALFAKGWHAPVVAQSLAGFCWWLFSQVNHADCKFFMDALRTGAAIDTDHPVHVLRERLLRDQKAGRTRGTFMRQEAVLWLIIRAWNAYRLNEDIRKLQIPVDVTDERFIRPR
jgi:hypothetical protein